VDSFFHQFLEVLKVAFHLHLEMVLLVPDIDLIRHIAGNLVDDDWDEALHTHYASYSGWEDICIMYHIHWHYSKA
jgi:hypothetical protein